MARIEPISREDMDDAQARVHDAAKAAGNPGCWTLHGLYPDSLSSTKMRRVCAPPSGTRR